MRIIHPYKKLLLSLGKGFIIILLIMIPLIGLNAAYPQFLGRLDVIVSQHPLACTFFRCSILGSVFLVWPILFRYIGRVRHWSSEEISYWIAQRLRILIWCWIWELIIGENIFLVVFNHWRYQP